MAVVSRSALPRSLRGLKGVRGLETMVVPFVFVVYVSSPAAVPIDADLLTNAAAVLSVMARQEDGWEGARRLSNVEAGPAGARGATLRASFERLPGAPCPPARFRCGLATPHHPGGFVLLWFERQ